MTALTYLNECLKLSVMKIEHNCTKLLLLKNYGIENFSLMDVLKAFLSKISINYPRMHLHNFIHYQMTDKMKREN